MARINFDDELEVDRRFKKLVRKLGNEDLANGMLLRFWRIAQKYWGDEMSRVPFLIFEEEEFQVLEDCGLAEREESGMYAIGSTERFDWYLQKCRASKAAIKARSVHRNTDPGTPEVESRSTETTAPVHPLAPVPVPALVPVNINKEEIKNCFSIWKEDLKWAGSPRELTEGEKQAIVRGIQAEGAENVATALLGVRHQPPIEGYNPKEYLRIDRVLGKDFNTGKSRFGDFLNWGIAAKLRKTHDHVPISSRHIEPGEFVAPSDEVRKSMLASGFGKLLPKESA